MLISRGWIIFEHMKIKFQILLIILGAILQKPFFVFSLIEEFRPFNIIHPIIMEYVLKHTPCYHNIKKVKKIVRNAFNEETSLSFPIFLKEIDPYEKTQNQFNERLNNSPINVSLYDPRFIVFLL